MVAIAEGRGAVDVRRELLQLLGQLNGSHRPSQIGEDRGAQWRIESDRGGTVIDHIHTIEDLLQQFGCKAKVRLGQFTHHGHNLGESLLIVLLEDLCSE